VKNRIYTSRNLSDQKRGVETRLAAFTDHLAVVLRIALQVTPVWRGRSYWKMNTTLLGDKNFQRQLRQKWADDQTNQTLPQHGPMVGKGRKNKHQKALHRRRN